MSSSAPDLVQHEQTVSPSGVQHVNQRVLGSKIGGVAGPPGVFSLGHPSRRLTHNKVSGFQDGTTSMLGPEPFVASITLQEPTNLVDQWAHKIASTKEQVPPAVSAVIDRKQEQFTVSNLDNLHFIGTKEVSRPADDFGGPGGLARIRNVNERVIGLACGADQGY